MNKNKDAAAAGNDALRGATIAFHSRPEKPKKPAALSTTTTSTVNPSPGRQTFDPARLAAIRRFEAQAGRDHGAAVTREDVGASAAADTRPVTIRKQADNGNEMDTSRLAAIRRFEARPERRVNEAVAGRVRDSVSAVNAAAAAPDGAPGVAAVAAPRPTSRLAGAGEGRGMDTALLAAVRRFETQNRGADGAREADGTNADTLSNTSSRPASRRGGEDDGIDTAHLAAVRRFEAPPSRDQSAAEGARDASVNTGPASRANSGRQDSEIHGAEAARLAAVRGSETQPARARGAVTMREADNINTNAGVGAPSRKDGGVHAGKINPSLLAAVRSFEAPVAESRPEAIGSTKAVQKNDGGPAQLATEPQPARDNIRASKDYAESDDSLSDEDYGGQSSIVEDRMRRFGSGPPPQRIAAQLAVRRSADRTGPADQPRPPSANRDEPGPPKRSPSRIASLAAVTGKQLAAGSDSDNEDDGDDDEVPPALPPRPPESIPPPLPPRLPPRSNSRDSRPPPLPPRKPQLVAYPQQMESQSSLRPPGPLRPQSSNSSFADAVTASSLAALRVPSPSVGSASRSTTDLSRIPPPPPPSRRSRPTGGSEKWLSGPTPAGQASNLPPPLPPRKPMRQTLRTIPPKDEDGTTWGSRLNNKNYLRRHPHKHHEGARQRWRHVVTVDERRRYEGLWAANRGLYITIDPDGNPLTPPPWLQVPPRPPGSAPALESSSGGRDDPSPPPLSSLVLNTVVRELWSRSRQPQWLLAQIWELVSLRPGVAAAGMLTREEFVVGMWLIDQTLRGRKLPLQVSASVWESVK